MGSFASTPAPVLTAEQIRRKEQIEERARSLANNDKKIMKLLLLGAGECGKSTILKQMKIIHLDGFTDEEKAHYKTLIGNNVLESVQTLCQAMEELTNPPKYEIAANEDAGKRFLQYPPDETLKQSDSKDIENIWKDAGIKEVLTRSREYHLLDSAPYFLDNCNRLLEPNYDPITQDILRCRLATTGIHQTKFTIDNMNFRMFDVGGQRGERKKWIHCFENVTAILYIASLVEYDQVLAEDRTRNRLEESLALFAGIINLPWFKGAAIILFLNKSDLFEEKIKTVPIRQYFPAYKFDKEYEDGNYAHGTKFIQDRYLDKNVDTNRTIYVHVTNATNTENIEFVWKCTRHIILEKNLSTSGLSCGF